MRQIKLVTHYIISILLLLFRIIVFSQYQSGHLWIPSYNKNAEQPGPAYINVVGAFDFYATC